MSWAARRAALIGRFNFECNWKACNVTEVGIEEEAESIATFEEVLAEPKEDRSKGQDNEKEKDIG